MKISFYSFPPIRELINFVLPFLNKIKDLKFYKKFFGSIFEKELSRVKIY